MRHFIIILVVLSFSNCGFLLYYIYPLSFWDKKGGVFFVFRPGMYFQTGQVFLSQNDQMGCLLVFYIGYILDNQKHFM